MKRRRPRRESRLVQVAVGASMLAVPASAAALADTARDGSAQSSETAGQTGSPSPIEVKMRSRRVPFGRDVVLTGRAPSSDAGQQLALQYDPVGGAAWRQLSSTTIHANGTFRLAAPLWRSGLVKVAGDSPSSSLMAPAALPASGSSGSSTSPERVAVAAAIRIPVRAINARGDELINLRGRLIPRAARERVELQRLSGRRWATLAVARTGRRGGFDLRYAAGGLGQRKLRVRFAGDSANATTTSRAGTLTVYRQTAASWYEDGGNTACGFHAYYGVANLSLPCGSKVSFMSGGRSVTAVVDDRGPYVGGRTWDLNQNTAGALGMSGVQTVWSSS